MSNHDEELDPTTEHVGGSENISTMASPLYGSYDQDIFRSVDLVRPQGAVSTVWECRFSHNQG